MDQQRIYELAYKWKRGTITGAEAAELTRLYGEEAAIDSEVVLPATFAADEVSHKARLWATVEERTRVQEPVIAPSPVRGIRRFYRYAAAAIVLIGIGTGAYFWNHHVPLQSLAISHTRVSIEPGKETALLTLADGSTIVLDSARNGTLAQQGNVRIVQAAGGQIAYHANGSARADVMMNTMSTPNGGKYQLILPDGSKAWLNAASSITYPTLFTGTERRLRVSGEVYFEIAPNKQQPFMVDVDGRSSIEVLGTHFNVNAYRDEDAIRTTLLEGKVRVYSAPGLTASSVMLKPGQQAVLDRQLRVSEQADIEQTMAWRNGFFDFTHSDIGSVMRKIARWYNVRIVYEGAVPKERLAGKLPMDASISKVLSILEEIGVPVRIDGNTIIVRK